MEKQLAYNIISDISDVTSAINKIFKDQWTTNRKVYNKIKHIKEEISRSKERIRHYCISGNEVKPERGVELLVAFKGYADKMIPYVNESSELISLKEQADSLITFIKLSEHEESAWNRLK